jgi:hypothetical protein
MTNNILATVLQQPLPLTMKAMVMEAAGQPLKSKTVPLLYIMEIVTTLFRAKLTQGLADFWVAANAIKACTKIVI